MHTDFIEGLSSGDDFPQNYSEAEHITFFTVIASCNVTYVHDSYIRFSMFVTNLRNPPWVWNLGHTTPIHNPKSKIEVKYAINSKIIAMTTVNSRILSHYYAETNRTAWLTKLKDNILGNFTFKHLWCHPGSATLVVSHVGVCITCCSKITDL